MRLYSQGMAFLNSPAAKYGDRYARLMSERGGAQYKYHVQAYGHPSKFGFVKDVIATWKADQFDPDALMDLYKKAGGEVFREHRRTPRQLRPLEFRARVEARVAIWCE